MQIPVAEIASMLNGNIVGDDSLVLNKVAKIEEGEPGALSFLSNPKYEMYLYDTKSSAVLVKKDFVPSKPVSATLIKVDDPYAAFTKLLEMVTSMQQNRVGVSSKASVASDAKLGKDVYIGEYAVIESGVQIGDGARIYPNTYVGSNAYVGNHTTLFAGVVVYNDCRIGQRCIIHGGTVIGSDGFGFAPLPDKSYKKIPQTGNVIIEDDVETGANCTIDRATIGSTIIRRGVKLDNLVQIAHNVEIGENTVIASQSGVAGSTKIGRFCIIAGQVGFVGHITIADGSVIGAQSGINSSIKEPNQKWFGTPIFEYGKALRAYTLLKTLPEMEKRLRNLEQKLKEIDK
jgi:UDP-3-O-[3-hydroxymyristoyl] glucosamine N-acyltransferase